MMRGMTGVAAAAMIGALAACGAATRTPGTAQPRAFTQPIYDAQGQSVGELTLTQRGRDSLQVTVRATRMPAGTHGTHLHAVGRCEAPGFTTAGAHLNPAARQHGTRNPRGPHLGDLPNLTVAADGTGTMQAVVAGTMTPGLRSKAASAHFGDLSRWGEPNPAGSFPADARRRRHEEPVCR